MTNLILRPLTDADEAAFFEGFKLWEGVAPTWYSFAWKPGMTYAEMLKILRNEEQGIDLAIDRVAHTMLYGFVDGKIIGRVSVRHTLNDFLRTRGGHIGYSVAPVHRKKGYATLMMGQALEYCRKLKMDQLLITCSDNNVPSWKIIENFGGKLEATVWIEEDKELMRRYWIQL